MFFQVPYRPPGFLQNHFCTGFSASQIQVSGTLSVPHSAPLEVQNRSPLWSSYCGSVHGIPCFSPEGTPPPHENSHPHRARGILAEARFRFSALFLSASAVPAYLPVPGCRHHPYEESHRFSSGNISSSGHTGKGSSPVLPWKNHRHAASVPGDFPPETPRRKPSAQAVREWSSMHRKQTLPPAPGSPPSLLSKTRKLRPLPGSPSLPVFRHRRCSTA